MANVIIQSVRHRQANPNTVYHALYGHYFLGISKQDLAKIYGKSLATVYNWFSRYEKDGLYRRKQRKQTYKKFSSDMRVWLVELYGKEPLLFLDEAKHRFELQFHVNISVSSVCTILHDAGLSWKVIERRAIQIRDEEIVRFTRELLAIPWDLFNLIFLDEVAFDNRDMLRRKGYGVIGQKVVYRGEFCRKPRESFLCFLGVNGILESFRTEGTFNRKKFFECCRTFALQHRQVQCYPGFHSVWIMDGARIHCDANIIRYLRSIGIVPLFLPAYCPFFNPIEVVFGQVKQYLRRIHREGDSIRMDVCEAINHFRLYPCYKLFQHCGYLPGGTFLPEKALEHNPKEISFNVIPE